MSGYDIFIPRNETARPHYAQNKIIKFCLPISTFMYLGAIYIFPGSICLFGCSQIGRPISGNIEIAHRYSECRNWERGLAVSFLGIHRSDFRYNVLWECSYNVRVSKTILLVYLHALECSTSCPRFDPNILATQWMKQSWIKTLRYLCTDFKLVVRTVLSSLIHIFSASI